MLSDDEIERIYALPPLSDEQAAIIRRLLRGATTPKTTEARSPR